MDTMHVSIPPTPSPPLARAGEFATYGIAKKDGENPPVATDIRFRYSAEANAYEIEIPGYAKGKLVAAGVPGRYPAVDLAALDDPAVADLVLLPDEPYVFTEADGPEAFSRLPTRLVSGRLLTWYGPALLDARISLDRS